MEALEHMLYVNNIIQFDNMMKRHCHFALVLTFPDLDCLKVNFFLKKMFRGILNKEISVNEIASFRFPGKMFLKVILLPSPQKLFYLPQ